MKRAAALVAACGALLARGLVHAEEPRRTTTSHPRVFVQVQSPDARAQLALVQLETDGWWRVDVCPEACNRLLDPRARYRITGEGVSPSPLFSLPLGHPAVLVQVDPGSDRMHVGAAFMTGAGGALTLLSLAAWGLSAAFADDPRTTLSLLGAGTGVLIGATGAVMMSASRTRVSFTPTTPPAR